MLYCEIILCELLMELIIFDICYPHRSNVASNQSYRNHFMSLGDSKKRHRTVANKAVVLPDSVMFLLKPCSQSVEEGIRIRIVFGNKMVCNVMENISSPSSQSYSMVIIKTVSD